MLIVHVDVYVKPESIEAFESASIENATCSRQEPGVARFDIVRDLADPCHFVLVEVYRDAAAPAAHKQTPHYASWRDTVEPMMAKPRSSVKFDNVSPDDQGWDSAR
jgi:quinol monooxygenase YgiN